MNHTSNIRTIAVSGASGFIGRALVSKLLAQDYAVRAMTRRDTVATELRAEGATVIRGGLGDAETLSELVDGADAVIHCAGATRGACYADFEAPNVAGTRALLTALSGTSIPLLAISSLAAARPELSNYARSKDAMERVLAAETERTVTVLRPPPVYGPGDRQLAPLFAALAWGIAPIPVAPSARVSLLYVDDLVSAILAWLADDARVAGTFDLHDGTPGGYSWEDIVATVEWARGARIRRIRLPGRGLDASAWLSQSLGRVLGFAPMLTPGKLRELRHPDWVCDNHDLCRALDWQPAVDLAAGFARLRGEA